MAGTYLDMSPASQSELQGVKKCMPCSALMAINPPRIGTGGLGKFLSTTRKKRLEARGTRLNKHPGVSPIFLKV